MFFFILNAYLNGLLLHKYKDKLIKFLFSVIFCILISYKALLIIKKNANSYGI